jgi:CII-binding regulator of phage lambda lysogenization HflD
MAASVWQVTLFDLDKQLNRQRALMERMADDIKHLRKQLNQVQRDLAKFQKRMEKIGTTSLSKAKRGKRRG